MSVAFKEWAVICDALGSGRQSIIIRKGGIAEGRSGFAFRHNEFVLFPTWFHEQVSKTILPDNTILPPEPAETCEIRYTASLDWSRLVNDPDKITRLREHHIWHDSVLEERFHYEEPKGLHIALVRVYRLDPPGLLRLEKRYGGCRSWVELPDFEGCALVSVLSDEEHFRRKAALESILFS
jgi:hypothetical protein